MGQMPEEHQDDYHIVLITPFTLDAAMNYNGISTIPGNFAVIKETADNRSRTVQHELYHQIVGEVPSDADRVDRFHTKRGALSHHEGEPWLNWPVIEKLEQVGFRA